MRPAFALLAFGLVAAPVAAQPAAPAPSPQAPANPYAGLFTPWGGVNRDSIDAEIATAQPAAEPQSNTVPAYSPLESRTEAEAVALGRRVGEVVRAGNCAEGERIAREAGDFALVRAVREHCRRPR
ncbi:MAG TPA: hypothetical protein VEC11_03740 [Allosphingosinicella sp.]|nr:hypothetical protein [Allosphingosinicella sp.]